MAENLGDISAGIVSETMAQWKAFQRAHTLVLSLSKTNPRFANYLKTFSEDDEIAPVSLAVSRVLEIGGEDKLNDLIARGRLTEAVALTEPGITIARNLKDIDAALDWARVAGARLDEVASTGLYRLRAPNDLQPAALAFLLDLKDEGVISTVAAVSPKLIDAMPRFGARNVRRAAELFGTAGLESFTRDMVAIDDMQARNIIWSHLPQESAEAGAILAKVDTIRASRDQAAAADLAFANVWGLLSPDRILSAVASVWSGDISWTVIRQRYAYLAGGAVAVLAILLLTLMRRFVPRRSRK